MKKKPNKLFFHLNNLTVNKKELDITDRTEMSKYSPFNINKFISSCENYLPLVNAINRYNIPKAAHYQYYFAAIPKRKHYFKSLRRKKDVDLDVKEDIARYFECSIKEASDYAEILQIEEIEEIRRKFKHGKM